MKAWSLFRVEIGRLFRNRLTWLAIAVTGLSPAAGLWLYRPLASSSEAAYSVSLTGAYLGNPALAGGIGSAVIFALLTALECSRSHRSRVDLRCDAFAALHGILPDRCAVSRCADGPGGDPDCLDAVHDATDRIGLPGMALCGGIPLLHAAFYSLCDPLYGVGVPDFPAAGSHIGAVCRVRSAQYDRLERKLAAPLDQPAGLFNVR